MIKEYERPTSQGYFALFTLLSALVAVIGFLVYTAGEPLMILGFVLLSIVIIFLKGLFIVNPNEGMVLTLFGKYVGSVKRDGLHWANPFFSTKKISLRVRNFESNKLKVNDHDGNPIEIAAIVVWKVVDTAEASFEVNDYQNYVNVQSESALRNLATLHPYDAHQEGQLSLRGSTQEIADQLKQELHQRLGKAGVEVIEARLSHLAYSPEIAQVMLRRQQASAIIAARTKIVEGAVSMVEMALDMLAKNNVVEMDNERKAQMVSNLMVVLCGEKEATPIVNTGTIYQ